MPRPAAAPPLAALAAAASLAAAPPAAGAGEPVGADWSLSAAFLSEAPPLTDDPAPRVAVRAPRNAAERATFAEALAWWSAESNEEVKEADPAALTWWAADGAGATAGGVRPASAAGLAAGPAAVAALAWWSPQEEEQEEEEADRGDDPAPADDADAEEDATDAEADAAEADAAEADAAEADAAAESTEAEALPAICATLPCAFAPLSEIGAGLNDPTAVLAATVRVETVRDAFGGECERHVPVAYREIAPPEDLVGACFAAAGAVDGTPYAARPRTLALPFCFRHRPLYFEDPNLERCGVSTGPCTQPLVSGAHFFGTIPLLPWWAATRPAHVPVRATPFCPPGRRYDAATNYLPPPEPAGALAEGAAAAALILALP